MTKQEIKEYMRVWRSKNRERCREYHTRWLENNREKARVSRRRWYHKNKVSINLQKRAQTALNHAVRDGKIIRSKACQNCGTPNPEAHHHNGYAEAHKLDVIWLCKSCHVIADKSLREHELYICKEHT